MKDSDREGYVSQAFNLGDVVIVINPESEFFGIKMTVFDIPRQAALDDGLNCPPIACVWFEGMKKPWAFFDPADLHVVGKDLINEYRDFR